MTLKGFAHKWRNKIMGRKSNRKKKQERKLAIKQANEARQAKQESRKDNGTLVDAILATKDNKPIIQTTAKQSTGTNYQNYYGGKGWHHKNCSHYPTLIAQLDNIAIYAATKSCLNLSSASNIDLIVNCSQMSIDLKPENLVKGPKQFDSLKNLLAGANAPVELHLDWTDGAAWQGKLKFWQELFAICKKENYQSIVFCCLGGHGRTGTAIASFIIANSQYLFNASELYVDIIRDNYCESAVETLEQERYLDELEKELAEQKEIPADVSNWYSQSNNVVLWAKKKVKQATSKIDSVSGEKLQYCKVCDHLTTWCTCILDRCFTCHKLKEFCSCSSSDLAGNKSSIDQCPNCSHFMDLCDCTTAEIQKALMDKAEGKEGKEFELIDMNEIFKPDTEMEDKVIKELTDKEQQEEANRQIITETVRQALKDYQWS